MPPGNPMGYNAYTAGQQQAQQDLGLQARATAPRPAPATPNSVGAPATQPSPRAPQFPRPAPMPAVPASPSAMVAGNAFNNMAQQSVMKNAAFSLSPNPDQRVVESKRDNVRQPPTNEDRRIATGIDPAFNYLSTPSESDPYTIPRMF